MTPEPTPSEPTAPRKEASDVPGYKMKLRFALGMALVFSGTYFVAALIATRDFRHIGQIEILGMPLALYTGMLVFVVGLVVTRLCLIKDQGGES